MSDGANEHKPAHPIVAMFGHYTFTRFVAFVARRREKQAREHYRDERAHAELSGLADTLDAGGEA